MDLKSLVGASQTKLQKSLVQVPRQLEGVYDAVLCTVMCSMSGVDHIEFHFDRIVYRHLREHIPALAFTPDELLALIVQCSTTPVEALSATTMDKIGSVLQDSHIAEIQNESKSALVCTLEEPDAIRAWTRPQVKLAVVCSYMFPNMEISDVHRRIFGVYVQADERRCSSLYSRISDAPPHTILKAQLAEALVSCVLRVAS